MIVDSVILSHCQLRIPQHSVYSIYNYYIYIYMLLYFNNI